MKRRTFLHNSGLSLLSLAVPVSLIAGSGKAAPLKVAVIGLVHAHVHQILSDKKGNIEIIAIVEPNRVLAQQYSKQHGYSMDIVFNTMEDMIAKKQPEAVTAFGTIFSHLAVVEFFAPKGIHVMVEKPLAVSLKHALHMKELAQKHNIFLLTNYETTWYATNTKAWKYIIDEKKAGDIRKLVFHTGHQGPIEIGCNPEFLEWLTDPVLNGAGALTDFGCYGANIATWLMKGELPQTVSCTTQHIKPEMYPKVEDESTIILTYPKTQVIIQASWNWPFSVKNMEVFGQSGYLVCDDRSKLHYRWKGDAKPTEETLADNLKPYNDPFALLAAVTSKQITLSPFDLSSLDNNMVVMQILEAAKKSVANGAVVHLHS